MERKILSMIFASVIIISFILISIKMQVSTIQNLNQVSTENSQRLGYKVAGSFNMLNEGEKFGVLTQEQYSNIRSDNTVYGCTANIDGFSEEDPLRFNIQTNYESNLEPCNGAQTPLPLVLYIQNQGKVYNYSVGESSEGFS